MAVFLDVHKVPFKEENLQELVNAPADEYGVTHVNLFYNMEAGVCFCLLNAPDKEAVIKHHDKVNIECEWITEVSMATGNEFLKYGSRWAFEFWIFSANKIHCSNVNLWLWKERN